MALWHATPKAVAILSRITPDSLCVRRFSPIVGPAFLRIEADDLDTGDMLEILEAIRQLAVNEEFGMTFGEAQDAGCAREFLAAYAAAPDVATVLAERLGDPRKFGGTDDHTATLLWRLEANEALRRDVAA